MLELIYAAALGQGALIVVLLISAKNANYKANIFLLLLLLMMLKTIYVGYARIKGWDVVFFERYGLYPLFLHGPLIYIYCSIMTNKPLNLKFEATHLLWLLFPLLWIQYRLYEVTWGLTLLNTISFLQLTFYYMVSIYRLKVYGHSLDDNFANTDKYKLRWLYSLVLGLGILMFIDLGSSALGMLIFQNNSYFQIPYLFMLESGYVFALCIFAAKQPAIIFNTPLVENTNKKYNRSGLSFGGAEELLKKMVAHVTEKKRYMDNELSLAKLSEELAEIPQHLSQALNENMGKNFYDFINELRVNECKLLLTAPDSKHKNLINIAHECGFNNKSSFNNAFKKHTGKTPSEYRKINNYQ